MSGSAGRLSFELWLYSSGRWCGPLLVRSAAGANHNHRSDAHAQSVETDLAPASRADRRTVNTFALIILSNRCDLVLVDSP